MSNEDIDHGKYSIGYFWWHKYLSETKENFAHDKRSMDTDAVGAHHSPWIIDLTDSSGRLLALISACLIGCICFYLQCVENRQITRQLRILSNE